MALYILVKRKGAKSYLGAIPVKKGVSKEQLRKRLRNRKKTGLQYRIATGSQVKGLLSKILKNVVKKPIRKKRAVKRRKTAKKRIRKKKR